MVLSLAALQASRLSSSSTSSPHFGTNLGPTVPPSWLLVRALHALHAAARHYLTVQYQASQLSIHVTPGRHAWWGGTQFREIEGGGGASGGNGAAYIAAEFQIAFYRLAPRAEAAMHAELCLCKCKNIISAACHFLLLQLCF